MCEEEVNNEDIEFEDVVLTESNIHRGDVNNDIKFDCENNCPYCNDQVICVKPIGIYLQNAYNYIEVHKRMKCLICSKDFLEIWEPDGDLFYDEINENFDFQGLIEEFEHIPETGIIEDIASYSYTSTEPFFERAIRYQKGNFPIYRRKTPEIIDMFDLGPIESRFDILDLGLDDLYDYPFFYFPRHK